MIRERMIERAQAGDRYFRWRGGSVSRLEGLADAVFALSLTLLVVSLEVPNTFDELLAAFVQLPVFAACFAILYMIWHDHFRFHRRYGLEDRLTIFLNAILLFLVLFYVYPLKFLCTALYTTMMHGMPWQLDSLGQPVPSPAGSPLPYLTTVNVGQMRELLLLYSAGFAGIYATFALHTWRAWCQRAALELGPTELVHTRWAISGFLLMAGIGVVSIAIALLFPRQAQFGGFVYFLIGPAMGIHGWRQGCAVARAHAGVAARESASP